MSANILVFLYVCVRALLLVEDMGYATQFLLCVIHRAQTGAGFGGAVSEDCESLYSAATMESMLCASLLPSICWL